MTTSSFHKAKRILSPFRRLLPRTPFNDRYDRIVQRLVDQYGANVITGPFAGMKMLTEYDLSHSAHLPKLIGCYEEEIHAAIYSTFLRMPSCVINIGSADGYYAVGYALRIKSEVYAFEGNETLNQQCQKLATINGVVNLIEYCGEANSSTLNAVIKPHSLLVVDCEGCEVQLLTGHIENLANATIIVETHDHISPSSTSDIQTLFHDTHDVYAFVSHDRDSAKYPFLSVLSADHVEIALNEYRHGLKMTWLYLVPRQ